MFKPEALINGEASLSSLFRETHRHVDALEEVIIEACLERWIREKKAGHRTMTSYSLVH